MVLPLLALILQAPPDPQRFVFENETRPHYTASASDVELRAGRGWLRMPRIYIAFDLRCEFQLGTAESVADVVLSNWTTHDVELQLSGRATDSKSLLRGKGAGVRVVQPGDVQLRPAGEWQQLRVTVQDRRMTVTLNGTLAGVYEIEDFTGYVLFRTRKGSLRIRQVITEKLPIVAGAPLPDARSFLEATAKPDLVPPAILRGGNPQYTRDAMVRKSKGVVNVMAFILADGRVADVELLTSLDRDLDRSSVAAVRQWRFTPARLNGTAVPAQAEIELTFSLR